jgi:2,3-diketo-5-methylthio-1-phosphopentane phosphatase
LSQTPLIFVDFDGTISNDDTTDLILQRLADPSWVDIEEAWQRGEIGSRECMAAQVGLLRATPETFAQVVAEITIDPGFMAFERFCRLLALPVAVLSDGLDIVAEAVLARHGISLPVLSNHLAWQGGDRWHLSFPHARPGCSSAAGNCKCHRLTAARDDRVGPQVLIGDGRSDFCVATEADVVFAKGKLAAHCGECGIPYFAFTGFDDLLPTFKAWLMEAKGQIAKPAPPHQLATR